MSTAQSKRRLIRLFDKQNGICCYCDGKTWLPQRESPDAARQRLGIPKSIPGSRKMLTAARATQEHLIRRADGGKNANNLKMACHACNVRRMDSEPEVHHIDMLVLVAAGLHPTNRPPMVDNPRDHLKRGLKALYKLRAGKLP